MALITGGSTPENQGPKVNIVCWLLVSLSAAFIALRVFCKFKTHRGLWWDDHILIVSWVFLLISVCCISVSVSLGLGKHVWDIEPANLPLIGLFGNVTATFSILAAVLSKTSFAFTLLRVTEGYTKLCIWVGIGVMNTAMGLSVLFTWIQCSPPSKTWDRAQSGTCWDSEATTAYSIFSAGISAAMDAALSLLPWKIMWDLQMKRGEKIGVAFAMSMGIFAAGTAIVKCTKLPALAQPDGPYVVSEVAIWGAAETATTIMAACIPVLRVLLRYFKSSVQQYHSSNERSGVLTKGPGTRDATTIVTSYNTSRPKPNAEDDIGSDKSILERTAGAPNRIVQTNEFTVEFHEQGRERRDEDYDSTGGYEMSNRGEAV